MAPGIRVKRSATPGAALAEGELGYATTAKELFVGNASGGDTKVGPFKLSTLPDVDISGLANGDVLAWVSGALKWEPTSVAGGGTSVVKMTTLTSSIDIPVPDLAAWQSLPWDTEVVDEDAWHSNVTNNSRVTVSSTGLYQCNVDLVTNDASWGSTQVQIAVNGTGQNLWRSMEAVGGIGGFSGTWNVICTAGDYIEILVYQNTGGTRTLYQGSQFQVTRLR